MIEMDNAVTAVEMANESCKSEIRRNCPGPASTSGITCSGPDGVPCGRTEDPGCCMGRIRSILGGSEYYTYCKECTEPCGYIIQKYEEAMKFSYVLEGRAFV